MKNKVWKFYENDTNIAKAAHTQINQEGKQLKLITAIMRFDFITFIII